MVPDLYDDRQPRSSSCLLNLHLRVALLVLLPDGLFQHQLHEVNKIIKATINSHNFLECLEHIKMYRFTSYGIFKFSDDLYSV